ncbi:hypothetical protein LIPSTDRAFT_115802 [Lipomyces starkeyi NRRL Y-11557]|uniref:Catalase core domain-containing protein n=1 Tax=Lipomyces starkeyi NRRL Y-11557 TaxID=675824 RepID=A0A1E3QEA5_LIPST|nr:hypothetical protein LIPSTDRAFT_115802 [Lipomyces starkeyi NRRL Y-11557]
MDAFPSKSFMREAQEHSSSLIPRETSPCSFDSPQSRQGSRGSADTVRDVRGFAVKFYTDEEFLIYQSSSSLLRPSS